MCSISFYPYFPIFNNKKIFYTSQKTHLKNTLFSRSKLTYEEIFNFEGENICDFMSRERFSKLIMAIFQTVFAQNMKNYKNCIFLKCTKVSERNFATLVKLNSFLLLKQSCSARSKPLVSQFLRSSD